MIEDRFLTRQVQYWCETEKRWVTKFERVPVQIRFMGGDFHERGGRWHLEPAEVTSIQAAEAENAKRLAEARGGSGPDGNFKVWTPQASTQSIVAPEVVK